MRTLGGNQFAVVYSVSDSKENCGQHQLNNCIAGIMWLQVSIGFHEICHQFLDEKISCQFFTAKHSQMIAWFFLLYA